MAQGEIERQGIYRFQNFFDMGIPIFVAKIFLVHVGYVYICEQTSFRLSERLRERGGGMNDCQLSYKHERIFLSFRSHAGFGGGTFRISK